MDYVKLRNAIFAESGYCLEPVTLQKSTTAYFCVLDTNGKPAKLARVPGCDDTDEVVSIPLTPYPNPTKAREGLGIMCLHLGGVLQGDAESREAFIQGWQHMLVEGMALEMQDGKTQLGMLQNIYGAGRVLDELNRNGTVQFLGAPDWAAMLDEALPA